MVSAAPSAVVGPLRHARGTTCRRSRERRRGPQRTLDRLLSVVLLVFVGVTQEAISHVAAQEPPQDMAARVATLRTQLDDERLTVRIAAERELLALGPEALPFLDPVRSDVPSDTVDRLVRIRTVLEQAQAERLRQPSLVTLRGEFTLTEALEGIRDQTGNDFEPLRDDGSKAEIALDAVGYWQAIGELLTRFPAWQLDPLRGGDKLRLAPVESDAANSIPVSISGPFRIEILRVALSKDFARPPLGDLDLVLRVRWEPRLAPLSVLLDLEELEVKAAATRLGSRAGTPRIESIVTGNRGWVDCDLSLDVPPRTAEHLDRLAGALTVTLPTPAVEFRFDKLTESRQVAKRTGSTVVTLERSERQEELDAVLIRVRFDEAAGSLESHRTWIYDSPARLVDAMGNETPFFTYETTLRREDEVGIRYLFPKRDDFGSLVFAYRVPSAILAIPVTYEFERVPLP